MTNGIKILDLFSGIAVGRKAIEQLGIEVAEHHAFEIDRPAIGVATYNFPDIIQHGDVTKINFDEFAGFDLLLCGSPCQDLSQLNHNGGGLEGNKSCLFYYGAEAVRRKLCKYFLFENVGGMRIKDRDIMTEMLGVEPIKICSSKYTAQTRNRLYWTNLPVKLDPPAGPFYAQDILEYGIAPRATYTAVTCNSDSMRNLARRIKKGWSTHFKVVEHSNSPLVYADDCIQNLNQLERGEVYYLERLTSIEFERLQGFPDDYTKYGIRDGKVVENGYHSRRRMIGNAWTLPVIVDLLKGLK